MIVGVGTDLCTISRIAAAQARHGDRFAQRVLGEHEQAQWRMRAQASAARAHAYLATRFSAKEAFAKAVGLGMRMPMAWRRCEIVNAASGRPEIRLSGELAEWMAKRRWHAHVSLSDERDWASAFVVVEAR